MGAEKAEIRRGKKEKKIRSMSSGDQILNVFQPQEDTKYLPFAASGKYALIFEKWIAIIAAAIIY